MRKIFSFALCVTASFLSCKKDKSTPDGEPPSISILKPFNGQNFLYADTVWIQVYVSDESALNSVTIELRNANGGVIWHPNGSIVVSSPEFRYSGFLVNNLSAHTSCILYINATDMHGNYSEKTVNLVLMGDQSIVTAIDYSGAIQVFTETVLILDAAALTGAYDPCAMIKCDSLISTDSDTISVDFGSVNCLDNFGRLKRGKIQCIYNGRYSDSLTVKQISFSNYFINNAGITGYESISNMGRNMQGNTVYSLSTGGNIVSSGESMSLYSSLSFERVAGELTHTMADDTWSITGSSSGVDSKGKNFTAAIVSPLVRGSCRWIVQGISNIAPQNLVTRILDYGPGSCDDQAGVSINSNIFYFKLQF